MRHALVLVVALLASRDPSCGGTDSDRSGPNAPCTREKDCKDGLTCAHGVCTDPDASAPTDAGTDTSPPADAADEAHD